MYCDQHRASHAQLIILFIIAVVSLLHEFIKMDVKRPAQPFAYAYDHKTVNSHQSNIFMARKETLASLRVCAVCVLFVCTRMGSAVIFQHLFFRLALSNM